MSAEPCRRCLLYHEGPRISWTVGTGQLSGGYWCPAYGHGTPTYITLPYFGWYTCRYKRWGFPTKIKYHVGFLEGFLGASWGLPGGFLLTSGSQLLKTDWWVTRCIWKTCLLFADVTLCLQDFTLEAQRTIPKVALFQKALMRWSNPQTYEVRRCPCPYKPLSCQTFLDFSISMQILVIFVS